MVWDIALSWFHRPTFNPLNKMSVKFTDDIRTVKGAVNAGIRKKIILYRMAKVLGSNLNQVMCLLTLFLPT